MLACRRLLAHRWLPLLLLAGCADTGQQNAIDQDLAQQAAPATGTSVRSTLSVPVTVLSTGTANINLVVFENPNVTAGATILDVHGLGSTGRVFDPLTQALYNDAEQGARVKRVITLDFVGHGGSSFPTGLPSDKNFGSLTLDDNVSVILQVMDALRAKSMGPQLVVGHSMGALALTAAQEKLLAQGSSFAKLGVTYVLAIAPIPSHGRPWTQPASAKPDQLTKYVVVDKEKGIYLSLPPDAWIQASFVDTKGKLAAGAPTAQQAVAAGYIGIEPVVTLLQLTEQTIPGGPPKMDRPTVRANAFSADNGTKFAVVSFSEDQLVQPADVRNYYEYLTGDTAGARFLAVTQPDAVHNMTISNPATVIQAMKVLFK